MMNKLLLLISLATSIVAVPTSRPSEPSSSQRLADAYSLPVTTSQSYIISLKPSTVDPNARGAWLNTVLSSNNHTRRDLSPRADSDLRLTWNETVFHGFAGTFSEAEIQMLRAHDDVKYIQPNLILHATATILQPNATWGLARISRGRSPLPKGSDPAQHDLHYAFDESAGEGVDIYTLDTGVRTSHLDFRGRAKALATFGGGAPVVDINGHGTHVAGTAAGSKYGVAKKANIIAIKCVGDDGKGITSDIVSAIDLAALTAASSGRPSIISMSLAGDMNQAIDDAVANAVSLGVPFVVSAGNGGKDAQDTSPARLGGARGNPGVITVGSTTITDSFAPLSNFGANIDVLAPGEDILSCGITSDDAVAMNSGTSMATAHMAGLAALIMGQQGKLGPGELKSKLVSLSVPGVISGVPPGTPNALGNNGATIA